MSLERVNMETKKCSCCGDVLSLSSFFKDTTVKSGYRAACKSCMSNKAAKWRKENKEHKAKKDKEYHQANLSYIKEQKKKYRLENKEAIALSLKLWQQANPDKCNARNSKRRAAKLNATPAWSDLKKVAVYFEHAQLCSKILKQSFHVDHIVPLQGKTVCGLHVPNNLQVLPATLNHSKNNHWWPEMWEERV